MGRFGRIALKTILWIIASVIFLVLLVVILIQVPAVQNLVKDKAVTFLQNKIHTKVEIGHISLGLPKLLVLENVYFEDQKKDTLIAGDKLKVDISMLQLLHHKVEINELNLQGITAKINRGKDSVFNFDYILKAFAGEQKKEVKPTDTTSTMKFTMDKIVLDRINVSYKDLTTGNDVKFLLGHFDTRIKDFDMDKMKFTIPKINLSGVNARIIQTPMGSSIAQAAKIDTAVKPLNMDLSLGTIDVSKIYVVYRSGEMAANINLSKFLVEMDKIDLKNQKAGIKSIALNDTKAALTFAKPQTVKKAVVKAIKKLDTLTSNPNKKGWIATLGKITLVNDDLKFDNEAQAPMARGLDFAHMHIRNLNADAENIAYSPETLSGNINSFTFTEKSGLAINRFHTKFFYGPTSAYLNDLLVETPQTIIQKQVHVSYPSIAAITKNIGLLHVNANVDGTRINLKDVLLLMPAMAGMEPFKHSPNSVFLINGKVDGQVNNLNIPYLEIRGLHNTHIKASARLKGLPDLNKAYFDVNIADFNTSAADIAKLVPAGTIPASISIPASMNLKGNFKGGMRNFNTKLNLRSTYGAADLTASMKNGSSKTGAVYAVNIKANNLNVGAFTKQPQMVGMVTLSANIKGRGLDPKTASLQFNGTVNKAYVKGYNYQNLQLKGTAANGNYTVVSRMRDANISFTLNAKANLNKKYPSIKANLMLDSINLKNLHLTASTLRLHGKVVADIPTADPDYLNANIKVTDLLVVDSARRVRIDSISLVSTATADSSTLRLKTPFLNARMGGKYKLTQVAPAMQDLISKYFDTNLGKAAPKTKPAYSPQQFTFALRIMKTPLLTQFMPALKQLDPVNITGRFNSATGEFVVNGTMPKIVYGTEIINNGKLAINTGNNALNYSLTVDEVKMSSSLDLLFPSVSGSAQNNKLNINVQVRDAAKKERYRMAGIFSVLPNEYQFSFLQDGVMFNYIPWAVNADNALQFGSKGILARNFTITNNNQVLSVNSSSNAYNSPITVSFRDFHIETLTRMAQQDSLQVGGVINGEANISDFQKSMKFTTALNINDFSFKGDTVGNIALKVNNQTENAYAANMSITGKGNQVDLQGIYYTSPESKFDLNLNIVKLNMKSIEGFSFGSIRNAKGIVTGQLHITGTTATPVVRGDVNFNQVGFNVTMLNSYFTMPKETITFNEDGILFRDFTLVDSTGNKAIVTGTLYTKTFTDFKFGIDINATNFRAVNSTQADNKLFYGKLYIDTKIQIRGTQNSPRVDANLTVNDKTDMTFVLPQNDPGIEDRKGVVEVINENAPKLDSIMLAKRLDSLKQTSLSGLDVNATININKAAKFTIVIDERNGDVVQLQGEARLNGGIDPSGKTSLTGTYTVEDGSYNLAYATVKRKFNFKKGSSITWTGDPTTANINLTAIYVANVPPIDLVNQQDDGSTSSTMLKQKLPFNVLLNLNNQLLKPDITFDIVLPDNNYTVSPDVISNVNTRLAQIRQDPNEMNKQVLGVLVLGHFIGDNPLQSQGGGTGINGAIRNSVSGLLSDQLNKLAGNLIGGVQLSFDLTSGADYSSGVQQNRTDLNVGLSKQFLNDRLTVTIGNNFNLEGQNQPGQKTTDIAGNLSVNYKLTADGRYMIRAYRRDEFIVVEGQVIETGVGFSLTYEYNRFKELFRKKSQRDKQLLKEYNDKQKEQKKEQKAADKQHDDQVAPVVQPADKPAEQKQTSN
ncbi:translocation/assembly module TamB domain-containing protein [Mucilaginibacter sp. UR6-11]|uniref:translocation/assembly module TamB domain-containing protein n=1 Tax=Mucilaginibacter sp. UR6-11 TaxID=1435644 RepID=UPI001E5580D0|nr:translocation/assembly module TamB domain-containing protein [Mucilaginibacter sp. UR6-11]MCC8423935.1 translocation/assembly module TamB domain-containing protein [Mucilaginibacter sp. UR6-11]